MNLRWISRDGKMVLQHKVMDGGSGIGFEWKDVPVHEEPKAELEYIVLQAGAIYERGLVGPRLIDERLVEKLLDAMENVSHYYEDAAHEALNEALDHYRKHVPVKK